MPSARAASALRPLAGRTPFMQVRELTRTLQADGCVKVDTNAYTVPWRPSGEERVLVADGAVHVYQGSCEIARHPRAGSQRGRVVDRYMKTHRRREGIRCRKTSAVDQSDSTSRGFDGA